MRTCDRAALLGAFATGVALAGCPSGEAAPGSCFRARDGACVDYPAAQAAAGKRMCAGHTWRDGAGTCPVEERLGLCTREGGRVVEIVYGGPPNHFTEPVAKNICTATGGQWAPAAGTPSST